MSAVTIAFFSDLVIIIIIIIIIITKDRIVSVGCFESEETGYFGGCREFVLGGRLWVCRGLASAHVKTRC